MPDPIGARRLAAARLIGAAASAAVGQVAVDMPHGYFGASDEMTPAGGALTAGVVLLTLVAVLRLLRRGPSTPALGGILLSSIVASFVPAMSSDPLVAGLVVLWSLHLLARRLLGLERPQSEDRSERGADALGASGVAIRHLAMVSLALIVVVVGLQLSGGLFARYLGAALAGSVVALAVPQLLPRLRRGHRPSLLILGLTGAALFAATHPALLLGLLAAALVVLLLSTIPRGPLLREILDGFSAHPSLLVVASFAVVILAGTVLLTFPAASAPGHRLTPLDALFTSTSAVCVTGLIVVDTPTALSPLGHVILLTLIQAGGLGIMILSTFATLVLGGRLGLRGEQVVGQLLEVRSAAALYRMTRFIVLATLAIEAAGALLLTPAFMRQGMSLSKALWMGTFHAVSAFCNAGFALLSDSLIGFQQEPAVLLVVGALIVLGGVGFQVLYTLWSQLLHRQGRLPVQVRVVMIGSGLLVVSGWVLYGVLEWNDTLAGLSIGDRLWNALFQSITLRTAGFNSVDFAVLTPASVLFMTAFMFIGASPGGTGGGIKVSTVAVLLAAVRASARGDREVLLFDRELSRETIYRAFAILFTSLAILLGTLGLLLVVEARPFAQLLFETASATGTVGLSLGTTPLLSPLGRLVIILAMFAGRVGPLTFALMLSSNRPRAARVRYPEATILVG